MSQEELRGAIDKLRSEVTLLDGMSLEDPPPERLRDLGWAVDDIRRTVWAIMLAEHSGDYDVFLGQVRVRRANDTCQDVLADLGDMAPDTEGLEALHTTLQALSQALHATEA